MRPPSPKPKDKEFTRRWDIMAEEVASRPNFKPAHFLQLEILCNLYCEYDYLTDILDFEGPTFKTEGGRNGPQERTRPEVSQRNVVISEIRQYNKLLGFEIVKTEATGKPKEKEEWD